MKKAIKTISLLCVLIFTIMTLGGCGTEPGVSKTQTDFSIVDEQGKVVKYLTADNSEVVKMKDVVEGYLKALYDRSYKTIKGDEEYGYYTSDMIETLNERNDVTTTIKGYKENQLESSYVGIDGLKMAFNKDFTKCDVTVVAKSKITNATDAFLSSLKIRKEVVLGCDCTLKWLKQTDVWKINAVKRANPHEIK
jgi:hypothetical protein